MERSRSRLTRRFLAVRGASGVGESGFSAFHSRDVGQGKLFADFEALDVGGREDHLWSSWFGQDVYAIRKSAV